MKEKIKSLGMELLDYDACSQIWVKSWQVYRLDYMNAAN